MFRLETAFSRLAALCACALSASCQSPPSLSEAQRVQTSEQVANVFVSAYPAVPWAEIADKLEPKHNLSTAEARNLAAVTTQSQVSQFLSTFAAGLALGLPSRTSSSATTVSDGIATTTSSRKTEPGSVPASSGPSPIAISDASLSADLTKAPFANGVDAGTQIVGGTAVFQLAQVLDHQISKALPLRGYQAHLLTFQVNLQPLRRDLPYDAYVNLTLMPGSWSKAIATSDKVGSSADELSPIIVYPLVIADAMETSNVGRSVEVIRQAALSLSGIVSNFGLNAGVGGGSDRLDAILGSDRNSLVTVGRVSDHTLRIRLGAQQQGSRKLALVPRTQNISVVVFTRAGESPRRHLDKLAVITETTFFDAEQGGNALSSSRSRKVLRDRVEQVVEGFGFSLNPQCGAEDDLAGDLLRALDRGDYQYMSQCLLAVTADGKNRHDALPRRAFAAPSSSSADAAGQPESPSSEIDKKSLKSLFSISGYGTGDHRALASSPPSTEFGPFEEARLRRVVASLMTLQTDSRYSKLMVSLQAWKDNSAKLPEQRQLVFLNDDKSSAKAVLRGGLNLEVEKLSARLVLSSNKQEVVLLPTSVEVDPRGSVVTLEFPSIVSNGLMATTAKNLVRGKPESRLPSVPMRIVMDYGQQSAASDSSKTTVTYDVLRLMQSEPELPTNPVSVTSNVLVLDSAGMARLNLNIGEWDAKKQGVLGLRVSGADIRATEPSVAIDAKRKVVPLRSPGVMALTLGNLTPAQAVQLRTFANNAQVGSAITLSVDPGRVASK